MKRMLRLTCCSGFIVAIGLLVATGCQDKKPVPKTAAPPKHDHAKEGPNGGPLADWDDTYHAEFTVDHAKKLVVVYILDDKAKAAPKIAVDKITKVELIIPDAMPKVELELKHDAALSSDKGIAFTVGHEHFGKVADIKGVLRGKIDGKPYNDDFTYVAPKKAALYLSPGGIYTLADVKANGTTTPTVKFKGKVWAHDDELKKGDKICPVTKNKAEADCAWIVQGQRYEFCCPPCVDKFIGWAHNDPNKVKNAKEYVFKGM